VGGRNDVLVDRSSGNATVTVYGAYGHTGRFVVAQLRERGFVPVLAGRDPDKLRALTTEGTTGGRELEARPASVDDPTALDRALAGADAVINCAGPFAVTAAPVLEAALRARIPYVDVAAEIEANLDTFRLFADRARAAGVLAVPAMAFYGGLGDLLVTAALGDRAGADQAHVAYGLDSWHPTDGTRAAGAVSRQRRNGRRIRYTGGRLEYRDDEPPTRTWRFPQPMGERAVIGEFTMADVVTIPSHLSIPDVCTYMTVEAARDLSSPQTSAPVAVDASGRSAQSFVVDVVVSAGSEQRRAVAYGRDIYAVSAPLAVEAVDRILTGRTAAVGVASAGSAFEARDFLRALAPHIEVDLGQYRRSQQPGLRAPLCGHNSAPVRVYRV
jgi:hypothetical protein